MPQPRRSHDEALYAHGVLLGHFQDDSEPWCGMKTCFGVVVTERGQAEYFCRGRRYERGPGYLQLLQPGDISRDLVSDGPATGHIMLFANERIEALCRAARGGALTSPQISVREPRVQPLLALHRGLERGEGDLAAESLIAEAELALAKLGEDTGVPAVRERPAIRRARAYLLERLAENVRLDELADHVRLDKYHLIRAFRAHVGVPPYEYLMHARIARARELLQLGLPASEVASAVGYCDQSQLNRHFVRRVGTTPARWAAAKSSCVT
jgi:AraC-like DNA-binding protein